MISFGFFHHVGVTYTMSLVLPDRVAFPNWVYDQYKYPHAKVDNATCNAKSDDVKSLFPHQDFVRQFIRKDNPFRGLLLYYGLGTGKTCASIAATDSFLLNNPPVYVFLPASLSPNYKQELLSCAEVGLLNRKWKLYRILDSTKLRRVAMAMKVNREWLMKHEDGFAWHQPEVLDQAVSDGWVVRESGKPNKEQIGKTVDYIIDHHFEFVHYNGLTSERVRSWETDDENPFNDRLIIIDEAHNFISRVMNGSKIAKSVYNLMMSARGAKFILLTGTPLINHPFELSYMLNVLRGEIRVHRAKFLKSLRNIPTKTEVQKVLVDQGLEKYVNSLEIDSEKRELAITFLPLNFVWKDDLGAVASEGQVKPEKHPFDDEDLMFQKVHAALEKPFHLGKTIAHVPMYALPIDPNQFKQMFIKELEDEDSLKMKNETMFMHRIQGVVSYFKSTGEALLPRIRRAVIEHIPMSNHQFKYYQGMRTLERKMEMKKKEGSSGTVYRAFSRMACNFVFPENVKRPFPLDIRKEMDLSSEDMEKKNTKKGAAEKEKDKKPDLKQAYENKLEKVRAKLLEKADTYLKSELEVYSPKFARILQNLDSCAGTALLYTQFRSMEGIGLFTDTLDTHEWEPLNVVKSSSGSWKFAEPLRPITDGVKRYIVYPSERDKATLLLDLFNGKWEGLPEPMLAELKKTGYMESKNLRGSLVKLLMITQSGAEGLSLKNVRQVHLMEPHWNQIRIDQVIGRAVRTCSHEELPVEDRNLDVFTYISTFTQEQLKDAFTIRRMDKSRTSDEHILMLAQTKDHLIQQFLTCLKKASVDCVIHAYQNKPATSCFAYPINDVPWSRGFEIDLAKEPMDYVRDRKEKKQKVTYIVEKHPDHGKVAMDPITGQMYDYAAYKEAKVLVPIA